jgi:GNAT acetyltransferase-like protein
VQSMVGWTVERVRLGAGAMASVQVRGVGPVHEAYVPRGPVPATREAMEALVAWARGRRFARLRVEPEAPAEFAGVLRELDFAAVEPTQPASTRIVPLGDPAAVLGAVDRGTRYNIRLAERRGVVVEEGKDADVLADQSAAVEERSAISLPRGGYYNLLLSLLPWCRTYVARHPDTNQPLSAVLVARHAGRGYNLFAGRSGAHSDLKSNELAHWRAISGCAAAGLVDYDLWGVPPEGAGADHPWHGIGAFKAGFGGREVDYPGAWQLVLSGSGSRLIALERKARRGIRGLKRNIS